MNKLAKAFENKEKQYMTIFSNDDFINFTKSSIFKIMKRIINKKMKPWYAISCSEESGE